MGNIFTINAKTLRPGINNLGDVVDVLEDGIGASFPEGQHWVGGFGGHVETGGNPDSLKRSFLTKYQRKDNLQL